MRKDCGFTLIEILVTISIAAILVTIGIPSMIEFMETNRRAAAANTLVAEMQRGRSTAATGGVAVTLCHSGNATGCSGEADPDWAEGWILFTDEDGDSVFDAGDEVLSAARRRDGVTMPSNRSSFTFAPGFQQSATTLGTVAVCVNKENGDARWIVVSAIGRPRLKEIFATDDPDCTTLGP